MANNKSWEKIFKDYDILTHNFDNSPYILSAADIKKACQGFKETNAKEPRLLCKQDKREDRPQVFIDNNLFILPIKNGFYAIVRGEGYLDIPEITSPIVHYQSQLDFKLDSSAVGDSEMQHLDLAYASSLIRTFIDDPTLLLTIRGRKYTPSFSFKVGKQTLNVQGVQTEVDAGYEGIAQIVLVEAKNTAVNNTIIRQLYYPFRQWKSYTNKAIKLLFFDKDKETKAYNIWQYEFTDENDYNSIRLVKSGRYIIDGPNL